MRWEGKAVSQFLCTIVDLKKAFDTVDHEILIRMLKIYGIDSAEVEWFRSCFCNRPQYCSLNRHKSNSRTCGIPKGPCLGPLLFIVYLNDFEECLNFLRLTCKLMILKSHSHQMSLEISYRTFRRN